METDGVQSPEHPGTRRGTGLRAVALARSCHLEPTVAVTAVATALALATGRDARGVIAVAAAVGTGQLCVGWTNDVRDRHRDALTGRTDKPVSSGAISARTVTVAAVAAAAICAPLSLLSGLAAGCIHLIAVAAGVSYDVWLKSTPASVLPYVIAFGLLPAFVVLGLPGAATVPGWLILTGAALGVGAHFANVLPDLADDRRTGVRGLPHRLPVRSVPVVAAAALAIATAAVTLGPPGPPGVVGWLGAGAGVLVLGAGLLRSARHPNSSRAAFRAVLVVAAIDVALLVLAGTTLT